MTNETTPDAVERQYQDSDGNPCDLVTLCRREPGWAANRIDTLLAERARHAEELAALRDQLRRLEGLIGSDAVRRINDLEIQLCTVRDQLDDARIERDSLRSLLPAGSLLLGFLVVIAWCAAVDDGRRVTDPHCETQETPTP